MDLFKGKLKPLVGAALLAAGASAQASLVLLGPQDFQGTGLGAANTVLTITSPANSTFESGSVAFGNVTSGDVLTGTSQTQTRTLGELGVASASSLRVVFNALEPGNTADNGITLSDLVLNIWSPTGTLLFTSGAFTGIDFADTQTGAGNSGFLFGLDAAQQAAAAAAFGAGFENNVIGLSATAGCNTSSPLGCLGATGGFETFFVGDTSDLVPGIPEPETYALMLAGLALVGWMAKRRPVMD
jgi:hypothetical protein